MDGRRFAGAVRDTVWLPPMREVTVAFDAVNPGTWAFHCHHLYQCPAPLVGRRRRGAAGKPSFGQGHDGENAGRHDGRRYRHRNASGADRGS
ncbi:multicopper oxidase domain-containing protein [Mesorhizobium sp.]|uniref:multicopper oxidase domain-containing protein n=1 Tax=Mesorhizobium sp. TaxID=1871066 RepID=UPI00343974EB